jgi:tRNA nucleotidyltransferase/poly(A) polymerase
MSDQGIQHAWIQHILTVFGDFLDAEQIDDSKFNFYLDKDDNWLQPSKKKGRLQDIKNLTKVLFGYLGEGYPMGISLLPSVIPPDIDCSAIREKLLNKLNDQLEKSLNFDIAAAHQTLSLLELFGESAEKIIEFRTAIDNKALFNDFVDQLNTITARKDHRTFSNQSKDTFKQDKKPSYQPTFIVPTSVVPQHPKIFPFEHALPVSAFPKTFIELAKYIIRQHDGALPLVLAGQAIADLLDEVPLSKINDFDCIWYGTPELWQRLIEKLIADQEKLGLISVERYGENMLHIIANNHSGSAEQAAQTVEIDISYRAIALDGRRLNQILLEDAERRDFKHTAMHIVLNAKQLLRASNLDDDPNQGLLEIHNKLGAFDAAAEHSLAFIGKAKKSIAEDPLRLLRAYRKILRAEVSYTPTPETQLAIDAATKNLNLWINDLSAKRKISSKAWAVRASQISSAFAKVFSNPVVMERLVQNGVLSAMIGFNQLQCEKLWQAYLELERLHDSKAVPLISVMSKQICFYLLIHALYGKTLPKDDAERKQWRPFHLIKWYSNMPPAIKTIAKTLNGSSDQYYISEALTKTFDGLLDKHFPELQPSPLAQDISQSTSKPPSPMI